MRKALLFLPLIFTLVAIKGKAQNVLRVHNSNNLIYQQQVDNIDSLKLANSNSSFYPNTGMFELPIVGIDSITFTNNVDSEIYIIYHGSQATIINPFSAAGVTITDSAGHVTATSTYSTANLKYNILGTTANGSLKLTSAQSVRLIMSHASITNPGGAAIALLGSTVSEMFLSAGTINTLNDSTTASTNGALYATGNLTIAGSGTLNVNGYKKHAIAVDDTLIVESGILNIAQAASDGIHVNDYIQNGGTITITPIGDGVDASKTIELNNGNLTIVAASKDIKGLKATTATINNGTTNITVSGEQSKAIKTSNSTTINGGEISLTASGTVVLEASGSGYDPSYCTGIKSDVDVIINGGDLTIQCPASNAGGKGISADRNIVVNGGNINISTAGNGATYTNENAITDSYGATCISADTGISLLAGKIVCSSSGTAGKGVSSDGTITIGNQGANDTLLNLSVTTSGNRFLVSGSGQNADYANPKAIKADGNLTVNSGIINANCTQSTEGGEGLESKDSLFVKGGQITATTYDDCINAATHIEVSGGTHSLTARGNDGLDCNGTLVVSGGLTISKGAGGPEEGFDCDNNTFKVLGGTMVGTGGNTSNPTTNVSTQNSLKLSITPNQNICIKNAANQVVLIYALPTLSGGGGGGGNNKIVMLFSDPAFVNGTYTIQYGGTISGGANFNGYYTGATYSGGSSQTFTVSSKYTTVNL
ncbi:MAG: carbohydrate-binding domain-containing protein [Chitinophagales bacterium]|nr:carbohydrate-binding domain-containing protein [Chitinophagales bacterium]